MSPLSVCENQYWGKNKQQEEQENESTAAL